MLRRLYELRAFLMLIVWITSIVVCAHGLIHAADPNASRWGVALIVAVFGGMIPTLLLAAQD